MKYIAYYRTSTSDQHLGLEAQRNRVLAHIAKNTNSQLLQEFQEQETGTNKKQRPQLIKALEMSKTTGATLIIAKLDRLSRSVSFISSLMDSGVEFLALDLPHASKLTIHIFSAIAQHEADLISQRTKAALQVLKDKKIKLGNPKNLTQQARIKGAMANKIKAQQNPNNIKARAYVALLKKEGLTLSQMADKLNESGFITSTGKEFKTHTVKRMVSKLKHVA